MIILFRKRQNKNNFIIKDIVKHAIVENFEILNFFLKLSFYDGVFYDFFTMMFYGFMFVLLTSVFI